MTQRTTDFMISVGNTSITENGASMSLDGTQTPLWLEAQRSVLQRAVSFSSITSLPGRSAASSLQLERNTTPDDGGSKHHTHETEATSLAPPVVRRKPSDVMEHAAASLIQQQVRAYLGTQRSVRNSDAFASDPADKME